jgi:hypothetical protein
MLSREFRVELGDLLRILDLFVWRLDNLHLYLIYDFVLFQYYVSLYYVLSLLQLCTGYSII